MANKSLRYKISKPAKKLMTFHEFCEKELNISLDEAENILKEAGYTNLVRKTIGKVE